MCGLGRVVALVLAAGAAGCAGEKDDHWDYTEHGPEDWGELSPDYVLAALGGSQSPVDIDTGWVIRADLPPLEITSHPVPLKLVNNGHTIEAVVPGAATLVFGPLQYELLQFHFHSPSEHTINGEHAEIEIHFVFSDGEGHLAVVAVLLVEGEHDNVPYETLCNLEAVNTPGDESEYEILVDIPAHLPGSLAYWTYDGSLTTPPASEGVRWFILKEQVELSADQIATFRESYRHNSRPVQELNARLVLTRE